MPAVKRTRPDSKKADEQKKEQEAAEKRAAEKAAAEKERAEKKEAAEKAKAEAAEKARQAKIDAGDLVVSNTHEFEASTKESKSFTRVKGLIKDLKAAGSPVTVQELADKNDVKYAEDYQTVFMTLEDLGLARRFEAKDLKNEGRRRSVAYQWIGD